MDDAEIELLTAELRRDEGEVLHAYEDSEGYLTIGVGRLIDRRRGGGISAEESAYLLRNDIAVKMADLDRALPWWRKLSSARRRVLVNMCFNLGLAGLLGFRNTLAAIEHGRYEEAARGMLASKWAKQVGARATRLAEMMRAG
jgi:lysozyme